MNIQCTICSDFINSTANLLVTKCGHLFHNHCLMKWIDRSKTCPQCRNPITPKCLIRVYLNTPAPAGDETVESVNMKLDHANLKIREQNQELKVLKDEKKKLNSDVEAYQKEMSTLKIKMIKTGTQTAAITEQLNYLQAENITLKEKTAELEVYKQNAQIAQGLQNIFNATTKEVDLMLQDYNDIRVVSIFAVALKKALAESEQVKNLLRNRWQSTKQELALEKLKLSTLQDKFNTLLKEYELEKNKRKAMEKNLKSSLDDSWLLNTSKVTQSAQPVNETITTNTSLNTLVNKIENADSPYLNLKQSSLACVALKPSTSTTPLKTPGTNLLSFGNNKLVTKIRIGPDTTIAMASDGRKSSSANPKLSIFQTTAPALHADNAQSNSKTDVSYDGLGGHSKFSDEFPKTHSMRTYSKTLTDKHRLKRPNPAAGTQDIGQMLKKLRDQ